MKSNLATFFTVIISSVIICWHALYNLYPLVTSDSGAYIATALDFKVLKDRSSFYSVFLAVGGLRTFSFIGVRPTVWLPVLCQGILLSILIIRIYRSVFSRINLRQWLLLIILISIGTGISWVASFIMPDIFSAILLLTTILYFFDNKASLLLQGFYLLLICASILIHNSHFAIYPLFLVLVVIAAIIKKNKPYILKCAKLFGVSVFCWLLMCTLNYKHGLGWTLSASSPMFLTGKLVEAGILRDFLDENCADNKYKLCAYKGAIPKQDHAYWYLWMGDSPFNNIGGWDSSRSEHVMMLKDIFSSGKYAKAFAIKSLEHTVKQLAIISIPVEEGAHGRNSSPYRNIERYIQAEESHFLNSRQQTKRLDNTILIYVHLCVLILSTLLAIFICLGVHNKRQLLNIYFFIILFIICNAFVTATFANVLPRLQNRVFWILPAFNIMVCFFYVTRKIYHINGRADK